MHLLKATLGWFRLSAGKPRSSALVCAKGRLARGASLYILAFGLFLLGVARAATPKSTISAGSNHALAVMPDGTVVAWGNNASGQLGDGTTINRATPVPVSGLSNVLAVSAGGGGQSLALKADGTVWAWGNNGYGQLGVGSQGGNFLTPKQIASLSNIVNISAGVNHGLALRNDGTVWAWGDGLVGDGSGGSSPHLNPVQVVSLSGVAGVAAGGYHSLAVKTDGTVWAWGANAYGQLGDGTTTDRPAPVQAAGLVNIASVSASDYYFSLAVASDGGLWGWGRNDNGELGDGTQNRHLVPVRSPVLFGVSAAAAGSYHTVVLKNDGTVWAAGYNNVGQVGDGSGASPRVTPVQVGGLAGIVAVATGGVSSGEGASYALRGDGTVAAWGYNASGQLADGSTINRPVPVGVANLVASIGFGNRIATISAGGTHTLAVRPDGTVVAWGSNAAGQLGDGTTLDHRVPIPVSGLTGVVAVSAGGGSQSLALKKDGTVWAWGYNGYGQLGDGTQTARLSPVQVPGLVNIMVISAGVYHGLALKNDGTVWAWGTNGAGELGDGTTTPRLSPVQVGGLAGIVSIAAGGYHSLALKANGTVWAWGLNNVGQLGNGTTTNTSTPGPVASLSRVTSIAASNFYFSLAVKADRTLWGWGSNSDGQLGDGTQTARYAPVQATGLSGVTAAAAGSYHTLALKSDGTVWATGYDGTGQLGDDAPAARRSTPVRVSNLGAVIAIAAGGIVSGEGDSLALKSDGSVRAWGYNAYGQLGINTITNRTGSTPIDGLTASRGRPLVPRSFFPKPPQGTVVDTDSFQDIVRVKFNDGMKLRAQNGRLMDYSAGTNPAVDLATTNSVIANCTGQWTRLLEILPEATLDQYRLTAQNNLGRELPDLNLSFELTLPAGLSATSAVNQLNTLPDVEFAHGVLLPTVPPAAPDFTSKQNYLFATTPNGIDATYVWNTFGTKGGEPPVRFVSIDYDFYQHLDLPGIYTFGDHPKDPGQPGSEKGAGVRIDADRFHGAATLGEVAAADDGMGTVGIATHAPTGFSYVWTKAGGYNIPAAVMRTTDFLKKTDTSVGVLLIEQQIPGPNRPKNVQNDSQLGSVPVEWDYETFMAIQTLVGLGVVVVEAGGNGNENLDGPAYKKKTPKGDEFAPFSQDLSKRSGAIIVGAGFPNRSRLTFTDISGQPSGSNYGTIMSSQGPGSGITTLGYGKFYKENPDDQRTWYTETFSGTSGASPVVAGACVLMQSANASVRGNSSNSDSQLPRFLTPAKLKKKLRKFGALQPGQPDANTLPAENIGTLPDLRASLQYLMPSPPPGAADEEPDNDPDY